MKPTEKEIAESNNRIALVATIIERGIKFSDNIHHVPQLPPERRKAINRRINKEVLFCKRCDKKVKGQGALTMHKKSCNFPTIG